jgi:hypothetical protein
VINRFERLGFFPEERMPSEQVNSTCFFFISYSSFYLETNAPNKPKCIFYFLREGERRVCRRPFKKDSSILLLLFLKKEIVSSKNKCQARPSVGKKKKKASVDLFTSEKGEG